MRKLLPIICLICVLALTLTAVHIFPRLPADSLPYVEKKYAGWSGVLRGWIASEWRCDGSFNRWLNACAADFEKRHEGVYLEFTQVNASAIEEIGSSGIRLPELMLFSPTIQADASLLLPLDFTDQAGDALTACGAGIATPVAMGGYIWVYNRTLCNGAPSSVSELNDLTLLPDDAGRCFSAAAVALLSGEAQQGELDLPDPGLDMGLPTMSDTAQWRANPSDPPAAPELIQTQDALTDFINGELPCLIVTQAELARLIRLREAGRGPDWACAATGDTACADQLLMCGVQRQADATGSEREALAAEFVQYLRSDVCQKRLADIGAFPVTDVPAHTQYSEYAHMEALLRSRRLAVPELFSEHSTADPAALLRQYLSGGMDAASALAFFGYKTEGYESAT